MHRWKYPLVGRAILPLALPPIHHVCNLWASPCPLSLFLHRSNKGFGFIKSACASAPPVLLPPSCVYPAQEAEAHANCPDEDMWENQTSVFNIDDRLACGKFSHPPKQNPFLLKTTGTGGYLCLAFPTVPEPTEQWFL